MSTDTQTEEPSAAKMILHMCLLIGVLAVTVVMAGGMFGHGPAAHLTGGADVSADDHVTTDGVDTLEVVNYESEGFGSHTTAFQASEDARYVDVYYAGSGDRSTRVTLTETARTVSVQTGGLSTAKVLVVRGTDGTSLETVYVANQDGGETRVTTDIPDDAEVPA